jgi:DNA repair protein RadD
VNIYTEGFDVPHIDCIVLLRSTLSAGLFSQMVGRGLRIDPAKNYCRILDFAGCIEEHGPVDLLGTGLKTTMAVCVECRESFSRAIKRCPSCGWEIPKKEMERMEVEEKERRMHAALPSKKSILSSQPETYTVDAVTVARHIKPEVPDSLRVQYRCGFSMFREWICLDHDGFAGKKAQQWWVERFGRFPAGQGSIGPSLPSVDDATSNLLSSQTILDYTKTITVCRNGKYKEIIGYNQPATQGKSDD